MRADPEGDRGPLVAGTLDTDREVVRRQEHPRPGRLEGVRVEERRTGEARVPHRRVDRLPDLRRILNTL